MGRDHEQQRGRACGLPQLSQQLAVDGQALEQAVIERKELAVDRHCAAKLAPRSGQFPRAGATLPRPTTGFAEGRGWSCLRRPSITSRYRALPPIPALASMPAGGPRTVGKSADAPVEKPPTRRPLPAGILASYHSDGSATGTTVGSGRSTTMPTINEAATEFLAKKRIAVTGVSRNPKGHGSNIVYQRLRSRGYQVFAVNPNADTVEGDRCYHDLKSIPDGVEAVVIGTRPERAEATMHECAELGIRNVWMHRGPGSGSVSTQAAAYGREHGITVIDGGCPLMFGTTADFGHKCIRAVLTWTGAVPRTV